MGATANNPRATGGRGWLSKTPSKEPISASKNQPTRAAIVRFLTLLLGSLASEWAMMVFSSNVHVQLSGQDKSELRVCLRHPQLVGRFGQQGHSVLAQELCRLLLRLFPGRDHPLQ